MYPNIGLIFVNLSSTASASGLSKANMMGLYVGKSVCDKNQNFTHGKPAVEMVRWENRSL